MTLLRISDSLSAGARLARGPIARHATAAFMLRIVNICLGIVTTIILGRSLGASGFGVFSLGFACATLISGLYQAAFNTHIVKSVASHAARENWGILNGIRRYSVLAAVTLSALVFSGLVPLFLFGLMAAPTATSQAALIGLAISPVLMLDATASALLKGLSRISRALIPQFVILQSIFLLLIFGLVSQDLLSPQSALISFASAYCISTTVSWVWVLVSWPRGARGVPAKMHISDWTKRCTRIFMANAPNILFGRIEVIFLASFAGPAAAGIYALAYRFAQFVTLPAFAVGNGLEPAVAKFAAQEKWGTALARIRTATQFSTIMAIAFAIFLTSASWIVFPIINPTFQDAAMLVGIISLGYIAQTAAGRPLFLLVLQDKENSAAYAGILSVILGTCAAFVTSAHAGAAGAAFATAATLGGGVFLLCYSLLQRCGMRSDIFASAVTP